MPYDPAYFDDYHAVAEYRHRYPDENVIRFLASSFPEKRRRITKILDVGCGCGRHLVLLREWGFPAFGIDGSPTAVRCSQELLKERKLSADVRVGALTSLPYDGNTFGGVIEHATMVNNDWNDIVQGCAEIHRVLKKGGKGFFLLKRRGDCAFDRGKRIATNTFLVQESTFISKRVRKSNRQLSFRAFSRFDIDTMFAPFSKVRLHTWEMSFKGLSIDEEPGKRRTSYWIVLVQK